MLQAARDRYFESNAIRAMVDSTGILLAVIMIDRLLQFPVAWNHAYLTPVCYATLRGGWKLGLLFAFVGAFTCGLYDTVQSSADSNRIVIENTIRWSLFVSLVGLLHFLNIKLQQTTELAIRDPLTGVLNRVGLERFGNQAIEEALKSHERLSLAVVDLDRFKSINDTFGHSFGDQILRTLVRAVRRYMGPTSEVARLGGDEFVVIFPGRNRDEAHYRLRKSAEAYIDSTLVMGCRATMSFGIAELGRDGTKLDHLLDHADSDLYRTKLRRNGSAVITMQESSIPS